MFDCFLARSVFASLFGVLLIATLAGPVIAQTGLGYLPPDPTVDILVRHDLPWITRTDLVDRDTRSTYWNTRFRGGRATANLSAIEYREYTSVEKDGILWAATGKVREYFSMAQVTGVVYPGFHLGLEAGASYITIKPENDTETDTYDVGWALGVFATGSIPLAPWLTWDFIIHYREWENDDDDPQNSQVDESLNPEVDLSGEMLRFESRAYLELLRDPQGITLDIFGGVSYHMYSTRLFGITETAEIHPPSSDDVTVLWGGVLTIGKKAAIRLEGHTPGLLYGRLVLSWIF